MVAVVAGDLLLGALSAAAAAGCYDTSYALQALEARRAPARYALRLALLSHLARRRLWAGAVLLAAAGWPLQLLALSLAPLTLVQPTLALGLLLLLALGARILREPVGPREVVAVALIVAGVAGIAWAAPDRTSHHAGAAALIPVLGALGAVAALPYALRLGGRRPGIDLVVSAGAGDAWAAFAAKLVVDELSGGHWVAALGFALGAALAVGAGFLSEMTALQRYAATRVGPVVVAMQVAVPVLLAPLLGGESWAGAPLGGAAPVVFLVVVAGGAAVLGSSPAVAGLLAGAGEHERRG